MEQNDKYKRILIMSGKISLALLFGVSVFLNYRQDKDVKQKDSEIDFLVKVLEKSEAKNEILKKNWEKRKNSENKVCFEIDPETNEFVLKKINDKNLHTR